MKFRKIKKVEGNLLSKKLKKRRTTNASFSKKAQFIQNGSFNRIKRCKSTGSVICNKSPKSATSDCSQNQQEKQQQRQSNSGGSGGIPWRTAARANRYRVSSSCAYRRVNDDPGEENNENNDEDFDEEEEDDVVNELAVQNIENEYYSHETDSSNGKHLYRHAGASAQKKLASSTFDYDKFASSKVLAVNSSNSSGSKHVRASKSVTKGLATAGGSADNLKSRSDFVTNLDKIKNVSVKDLLAILQREQESKSQLEDMLIQVNHRPVLSLF